MEFSQQYVSAIVIVILAALKMFGIEVANDVITGIVTGLLALWIAFKRHQQGDINVLGKKK